jgi:hypothetical protein
LDLIGNSTVTIRDSDTIVHKCKLVLELTQGDFPTDRPLRWLALYSYLRCVEEAMRKKRQMTSDNQHVVGGATKGGGVLVPNDDKRGERLGEHGDVGGDFELLV